VVGAVHVEHARADHARVDGREDGAEGEPRQDQVVRPLHRAAARLRRREDGAVAADRRPLEPVAEDVGEDQADPERVRRDSDQHEDHAAPVEQRARAQRREEADRKRDQQPDQRPDDRSLLDPDRLAQRRPLVDAEAAPDRRVVARNDEEEDVRVERA
jgi:hypothetical protein